MKIKRFEFNMFPVNCYVLWDETNEAAVIDAGCFYEEEKQALKGFIKDNHLEVKHLLNTHLHLDHIFGNPFMLIPTVLIAIILPGFSYLWFAMGWGTINYVNFDMNFAPNAVSAFFMSGGDWRNVLLICINFVLAALIWYPFFKAADKAECKKEAEREAAKAAKKAAKAAAKA